MPLDVPGADMQAMQMHMNITRKKDNRKPTVVRMSVSVLHSSRPAKHKKGFCC